MKHSVFRSLVLGLLVATLPGTAALFFGALDCAIDFGSLFLGQFEASCETRDPTCPLVCLYTEVYVGFNLLAPIFGGSSFVKGGVCLYPEFLGPTSFPIDLCLEINSKDLIGFDENGNPLAGDGQTCVAKGDRGDGLEECDSCFVCADGGVTLDCSNIDETAMATCANIGIDLPTEWGDIFQAGEVTYPEFDE